MWYTQIHTHMRIHQNFVICAFPEVHDDVETTTNEIKKAANNARNKLKSETSSTFLSLALYVFIFERMKKAK